jgi:hypothetical protein
MHLDNWGLGIQTTVETDQQVVEWGTFSMQLTWALEEPPRPSLQVMSILAPYSTTHPSSAGEKIVMVSWAKGILTTVETDQQVVEWGTDSLQLNWVPEEPPHPLLLVLGTRVFC